MLLFFVLFVPRERIELPSLRLQFSALPLSYPGYISPFIFFSFLVVLIYSFFFQKHIAHILYFFSLSLSLSFLRALTVFQLCKAQDLFTGPLSSPLHPISPSYFDSFFFLFFSLIFIFFLINKKKAKKKIKRKSKEKKG